MGYSGWIRFLFNFDKGKKAKIRSKNLWFTHGYGGGGPVTEDMIQSARQRVFVENADIMCSGHVHRSWSQDFVKISLNHRGEQKRREGFYVKIPTYKDSYGEGRRGFEVERGHGPRPKGAWWLRFTRTKNELHVVPMRAI
jgi:hypothetical protein